MDQMRHLRLEPPVRSLLAKLAAFFSSRGAEAYAAGGFLRDALLGLPLHDIDVVTTADPLTLAPELASAFQARWFPLDEERRLIRILLPDLDLHLDLQPQRGGIEADLMRRDYTIDAMAVLLPDAAADTVSVLDPTGGLADLEAGQVRAVTEEALQEDPLRLLRGVRLAAQLDFRIEPATAGVIRRYAALISTVAAERQRDEIVRILSTVRAGRGLRLLDEVGLVPHIFPEMEPARGAEQPKEHYWDVLGHSLAAVDALDALLAPQEPPNEPARSLWRDVWSAFGWWQGAAHYLAEEVAPGSRRASILKLAGFLHDIGKPATRTFDETGRMRFFGHQHVGANVAASLMRRLRFSSRETAMVRAMVAAHLRPVQMAQQGPPTRRAIYRFFRDTGEAGIETLLLSLADHLATVGPRLNPIGWSQHVALVSYILEKRFADDGVVSPPKLLGGDELMAALGLSPGPLVGRLLEAVREAQAAGEVRTTQEALALAARLAAEPASPDQPR